LAADAPEQLPDQQVRALRTELAGSHALLKDGERPSYSGLGARIEQLLRQAEQQATDLVEAARAEAARITAAAGAPSSASGLGSGQDDLDPAEGQVGGPEG
jgi:cell division septum initiation protein DivIVA